MHPGRFNDAARSIPEAVEAHCRAPRARRIRLRRFVPTLVGGAVLASALLVAPSVAQATNTQPSHFIQTATSSNIVDDFTLINNGATNGNPNALLFVTPNYDPGQVCGCVYEPVPVGVFYETSADEWAIFNEDQSAMTLGESFNVLVVPSASKTAYTITASPSDIFGDRLPLNTSVTNDKPASQVLVTQNWNPGGVGGAYNDENPGVEYVGLQWAIFNESTDPMTPGVSFNVLVGAAGGGTESTVKAKQKNIEGDGVVVNSTVTNGDSNAFALDTPNWNPKGVGDIYDKSPAGVYDSGSLLVFNESGAGMMPHSSFNVLAWNS